MKVNALLVLFLVNLYTFGQNGYYILQGNNNVELHMHDGYYVLDLVYYGRDVVTFDRISYGSYNSESEFLTMYDSILGYEMKMKIVSDTNLMFLDKGYCEMRYRFFNWWKPSKFIPRETAIDFEKLKNTCADYRNQKTLNPFFCGHYVFANITPYFDLTISENGCFQYSIDKTTILEGVYERIGNVLLLKDSEIKEPFYVLIEKDNIIPCLPGLFGLRRLRIHVENDGVKFDNLEQFDWYK